MSTRNIINALDRAAKELYDGSSTIRSPAHHAALGVIELLDDRGGFDQLLGELDQELRREIIDEIALLIEFKMAGGT